MDHKKQSYLELSESIRSLAFVCANEISDKIKIESIPNTRGRVLFALAIKICQAFEVLIEDAKNNRAESIHHLKTMLECFILFYWVVKEENDVRARIILAESARQHVTLNKEDPAYGKNSKYTTKWQEELHKQTEGIEVDWHDFRQKRGNLGLIIQQYEDLKPYYRLYRLACGPPHIGDIREFLPSERGPIALDKQLLSDLWSDIALFRGIDLMIKLLSYASISYVLGHERELSEFSIQLNVLGQK